MSKPKLIVSGRGFARSLAVHDRGFLTVRLSSRSAWAWLALVMWTAPVAAQSNFYEDKTIKLVIGFSAGHPGGNWAQARIDKV